MGVTGMVEEQQVHELGNADGVPWADAVEEGADHGGIDDSGIDPGRDHVKHGGVGLGASRGGGLDEHLRGGLHEVLGPAPFHEVSEPVGDGGGLGGRFRLRPGGGHLRRVAEVFAG